MLTRTEFFTQMSDAGGQVHGLGADGQPIGMITLTRHLESVPWISPEYFAARYPDQWARNAVYYLGFTACPAEYATYTVPGDHHPGVHGATSCGARGDGV